ncbi:Uma2 family endonuclease [Polyangium jinanense]|uniref:Uma2 family endonuclease n=1 Tax=Polyangium jinanense TaxID=2829994 RepID=A0A9X3X0C0_9BACT|nr:Uma2 family endonuclease [Polyangium jinanense]MDC3953843.1 Uma2 family endonuclease [Polyangium jinanense]MDC3979036.1 Uma2 family endonuclease [Polyangium jinanense]
MMEPARRHDVTFAEYLAFELASETKHEYVDGQILDRFGDSPEHALVSANVVAELGNELRDRDCRVFGPDVRIRVQATGASMYPDVTVVRGKLQLDAEDKDAIVNSVVLVEVLSQRTEGYDRGDKFAHYRRIPSLREYVLVSSKTRRVEVFRRHDLGGWALYEAQGSETIELISIGCTLALDEVYRGAFEEPELAS